MIYDDCFFFLIRPNFVHDIDSRVIFPGFDSHRGFRALVALQIPRKDGKKRVHV